MITELGPGATLAGYRIESVIGRGGMGVVYLAQDLRLSRRVAIKLIAPGLSADPRFRERFLREAELTASLDHPHVLPVYGAGETDGLLWTAMRYVEGEDLDTLLAREGPLAPARAVELARQIGEALDAAHARGLVHRDVKPANVLVAPVASGEHCYLTDFGLARAREDEPLGPASPHLSGTVAYTAPERIAGRFVDGRADVYSLGCVLFECLAGQTPFARRRLSATLAAHMDEEPPSVWLLRPQLPSEIDDVIARALAKDPEERYASCAELAEAARAALAPAEPWWRTRRAVAAAVMLVVVVLAAALAVAFTRNGAEPVAAAGPAADSPVAIAEDSLVRLDTATGDVRAAIPLGTRPSQVGVLDNDVFVVSSDDETLTQMDAETGRIRRTVELAAVRPHLLVMDGRVILHGLLTVYNETFRTGDYDPASGRITTSLFPGIFEGDKRFTKARKRSASLGGSGVVLFAPADDYWEMPPEWALTDAPPSGFLYRIEPDSGELSSAVRLNRLPAWFDLESSIDRYWLAAGEGVLGLLSVNEAQVYLIDPTDGRVTGPVPVGRQPGRIVATTSGVWVTSTRDHSVTRIDPITLDVSTTDVGGIPTDLAVGAGAVWVTVDVP